VLSLSNTSLRLKIVYFPPLFFNLLLCVPQNKLLVGTMGSEMYEISQQTGSFILLNQGHCANETWGLTVNPVNSDLYVTCGDDMTVRMWTVSQRKCLRKCALVARPPPPQNKKNI
jgi:hypothetical protein